MLRDYNVHYIHCTYTAVYLILTVLLLFYMLHTSTTLCVFFVGLSIQFNYALKRNLIEESNSLHYRYFEVSLGGINDEWATPIITLSHMCTV